MPSPATSFEPRAFLTKLFQIAVDSAQPDKHMAKYLPQPPKGRTLVLGAGKAAGAMAYALEAHWPRDAALSGLLVTRYAHTPPRPQGLPQRIEIIEAAHPVPDMQGMHAAEKMLALAEGLGEDDLLICLVSGGGSALLSLPCEGLRFEELQTINQRLLESGASISEINCLRKHLSLIKGGRLALAAHPAQVLTLAISDIPGDAIDLIASGPSVADSSSCEDALAVAARYQIQLPGAVLEQLRSNALETPKPDDVRFANHTWHIMARPQQSLEAAAHFAQSAGINAYILSDAIEGESREVAKMHAALAKACARPAHEQQLFTPFTKPCLLLSGGETSVTLRPLPAGLKKGRGGRNGEFCLSLAMCLQGAENIWVLAADTDGIDGVENNAGALVAPSTLARAAAKGLNPSAFLTCNDAYSFFEALDDLLVTGPSHTNVNDFRAILIL